MEEVASSILASSTSRLADPETVGWFFGGLTAAEGSFSRHVVGARADGSERLRFVFAFEMAERDEALVRGLHQVLGVGSVFRREARSIGWLPTYTLHVGSRRSHIERTVPFMDGFLPPGRKRDQFLEWRQRLMDEERAYPNRWGRGRSVCRVAACGRPVRGRGLCRRHYYLATGH